jgi:hypothetical protein
MTTSNQAPPEGQDPVLPSDPSNPSPPSLPALDWSNPDAARRWLLGVETVLEDALGAAADRLLPRRQRHLGHVEAERILREATIALHHALDFARRGLPPAG